MTPEQKAEIIEAAAQRTMELLYEALVRLDKDLEHPMNSEPEEQPDAVIETVETELVGIAKLAINQLSHLMVHASDDQIRYQAAITLIRFATGKDI